MKTVDQDPDLDLAFERFVDLPAQAIWDAWTRPERLMPWFCPHPWRTVESGIVTLSPRDGGTLYGAQVRHGTPGDRQKHVAMGFEEGWGKALDQLLESVRLPSSPRPGAAFPEASQGECTWTCRRDTQGR